MRDGATTARAISRGTLPLDRRTSRDGQPGRRSRQRRALEINANVFPPDPLARTHASGTVLRYADDHLEDKFGMLSDQPLEPKEEYLPLEITKEEFEREWARPAFNR